MEISKLIGAIMITGLFVIAIFSFGHGLQEDNGVQDTIYNNSLINSSVGGITTQLNTSSASTESSYNAFSNDTGIIGSLTIILTTVPTFFKVVAQGTVGIYNLTFGLIFGALGIPAIVQAVIVIVLLVGLVIGISYAVRGIPV